MSEQETGDRHGEEPTAIDEPVEDEDRDDEFAEFVLQIDERKLMWTAIAVLTVAVVILSITVLGMRSRLNQLPVSPGGQMSPGGPQFFSENQGGQMGGGQMGGGQMGGGQMGGGQMGGGPGQGAFDPARAPRELGGTPNNAHMEFISGDEAMKRVATFIADHRVEAADAAKLTQAMEAGEATIVGLIEKKERGELDEATFQSEREQELERRRAEITKIIGWQLSASLHERLRGSGGS